MDLQDVFMGQSDCREVQLLVDEWKSAIMVSGAQCVMMDGKLKIHK